MSKINQIQNALKELDGAAFQKLADSYLLRKGYPPINPIGSVAGMYKTRTGTPDTFMVTDDGKYIFAEYTTISEKEVFTKFNKDIAKCLDEKKTSVPITKIEEIVLCYTSELSLENIEKLKKQCEEYEVNLNIFGLGAISNDLLEKYPSIAKDYLGVEIDTGQIVSLDVFISRYEKNKLATTLQTEFHFRVNEKDSLLSLIQNNDLIIISGKAGVGKSRIAIECYREYLKANKEDYKEDKAYCIYNKEINLFEDIKSYFSAPGHFLIFVDDANRISGFQYIVQLLQEKRDDQNFKIIVTVRDYALDKIKESCQSVGCDAEIAINPFSDEEINKFLETEFEIKNHQYLDRIVDIALGNPRLAVMAAEVAKNSNTLESIRDVSGLYDQYYSSIKSDLDKLDNGDILKVVGIVAFFRSVDKTNDNLMSDIQSMFGITPEDFWKASKTLHDMEVLNMFENEVVKVSDQVLSTYLFYLVFFKEKLIDFSILTDRFPQYKEELLDAINPILNSFNFDEIKKIMEKAINSLWDVIRERDEDAFLQLIDLFWFLKPTETLLFIQDKIDGIESQDIKSNFNKIQFEPDLDSNSDSPGFLSRLLLFSQFLESKKDTLNLSLDLLLSYAKKQPLATPIILHSLIERYGFKPESYDCDYFVQDAVINKLLESSRSGSNEYFSRLFIPVAENYLHIHFSSTQLARNFQIIITKFDLKASKSLFELRQNILKYLFCLYKNEKYRKYILKLLVSYTQSNVGDSFGEIVKNDSNLILSFLKASLAPSNLYHCIVVKQYLKLLKSYNIQVDKNLKTQFQCSNYKLFDLLRNRSTKNTNSVDECREYKKKEIAKYTSSYSKEDYDSFFHQILEIYKPMEESARYPIDEGIILILKVLASRNPDLFYEVVMHYLEQGDYLEINPSFVVSTLLSSLGAERLLFVLNKPEYPLKNKWLFSYYEHLPIANIHSKDISALCDLYEESDLKCFILDLDDLLKYESIQKGFVADIVQIIIRRASKTPQFVYLLFLIFQPHTEINKTLNSVFLGKFKLLGDAYIALDSVQNISDDKGKIFSTILDNDPTFIDRYLKASQSYRSYSFIWERNDYVNIMQRVTSFVFENECDSPYFLYFSYYESFYNKDVDHPETDSSILEKQNDYLLTEIKSKSDDNKYMQFLFSVISSFSLQRKVIFYKAFLEQNKKLDDFKKLPFEPSGGWSPCRVPSEKERIGFYEEVIKLCNSLQLLRHTVDIEKKIRAIRAEIQSAKKKDFMEA